MYTPKKRNIVLVILDAFRGDYIDKKNTPFLYKISKHPQSHYVKSLVPSFGFCERTEILTGKSSIESGYFTALGFNPEHSPYLPYRPALNLFHLLEKIFPFFITKKILRRLFWLFFKNKKGTFYPFNIPFNSLSKYCLTEDGLDNLIEKSDKSIYNIAQGIFRDATTDMSSALQGDDNLRIKLVLKNLLNDKYQFYPTYIAKMDFIGHYYGPSSKKTKIALLETDKLLSSFYESIIDLDKDCEVIFCGDHGMSEVKNILDIEEIIKGFKKKFDFYDFDYFLDSTVARFWFKNPSSKYMKILYKEIENKFAKFGDVIAQEDYLKHEIPISRNYGDMCFICNLGNLISPDFFNSNKKIKGMHGYRPTDASSYGFYIHNSNQIKYPYIEKVPQKLTKIHEVFLNILSHDPKCND